MKLTTERLKRLIREEISKLSERQRPEAELKGEQIVLRALTNLEMINLNTGYGDLSTDYGETTDADGPTYNQTTISLAGKPVATIGANGSIYDVQDSKLKNEINKLMAK